MNFYSIRDLRTDFIDLWNHLSVDNEIVIKNYGKPATLMVDISNDTFDDVVQVFHQAKAMIAFNNMRRTATSNGFMTDE